MVERATGEIVAGARPRHEVQRDIRLKERARDALAKRYRSATLPEARPPPVPPLLGSWCLREAEAAVCFLMTMVQARRRLKRQ